MPELPEVETIKNELLPRVVGRCFRQVTVFDRRLIEPLSAPEFRRRLTGQTVEDISRRGKYLLFQLSSGQCLIMHLRMTGTLLLDPEGTAPYPRASFTFNDGTRLVFNDRRRLGRMRLVGDAGSVTGKLGPEPLEPDFTVEVLAQRLAGRRIPLKVALVDQGIISGIGNMYADEILFSARLHPLRTANSLSGREIQRIHSSIQSVLCQAIASKGASTDTYVRPGGQLGTAHFDFSVAHREGRPCPVCRTPIERIFLRGRGTCFCPRCQQALPTTPRLL